MFVLSISGYISKGSFCPLPCFLLWMCNSVSLHQEKYVRLPGRAVGRVNMDTREGLCLLGSSWGKGLVEFWSLLGSGKGRAENGQS